ncbi:MAG: OmpP1/FadL family transporter [Methylophilaceae bacterium]
MKHTIRIALSVLTLSSTAAHAAGFALIEQSASVMGNAFAGAAASAEDASTIFFNPAGMTYLPETQLVAAAHLIRPSADFTNNGTVAGAGKALNGTGGDIGELAFVPNMYFAKAVSPNIRLGIGVNAPFGLKTEYDNNWMGRFQAIKSEIKTININPSIAFKVNDQLSLGVGISAMRAEATLTRAVNLGAGGETTVGIKGNDWGVGYNVGAIYQFTPDTRVGVSFRSKVDQTLKGRATFGGAAAALSGDITASTALPENVSVSAFSKHNDQWDVMGDVTWTHWSRFKELRILRTSGALLTLTPENWENTLRFSVGANYHYNDALKLRAGVAYDQEAVSDQFRTARIPGNDRTWLAIGAQYKFSEKSVVDVGYAHLFIKDASIDDNQIATGNGRVRGQYEGDVNILSLQYTHNF